MSLEALRLACNAVFLEGSGTRAVLADRLYQFYHPLANATVDIPVVPPSFHHQFSDEAVLVPPAPQSLPSSSTLVNSQSTLSSTATGDLAALIRAELRKMQAEESSSTVRAVDSGINTPLLTTPILQDIA
jgi:hypothetical protein